jgi:hypothetical protein
VIEIKSGRELARLPTRRKVLHGVVVSPDDRYAFVSVEGIGSEPGTVEIIDLAMLKIVASVEVAEGAADRFSEDGTCEVRPSRAHAIKRKICAERSHSHRGF